MTTLVVLASCSPTSNAAPLPDPPRTEVDAVVWNGQIAVVGGLLPEGHPSSAAHLYNPTTDEWTPLPSLPRALNHSGFVVWHDRLWVVGGYVDNQFRPVADVWSLGADETRWRAEAPLPAARGALAVGVVDDLLVVAGGVGTDGEVLDSVVARGHTVASWSKAPALGVPREHSSVGVRDGRLFVVGGRQGNDLETNLATVESWAPGEPAWAPGPPLNAPRSSAEGTEVGELVCVAGGVTPAGTVDEVECLDAGGQWSVVALLAVARQGAGVAAVDGTLHVIGGGPEPGFTVSNVHEAIDLVDAGQ